MTERLYYSDSYCTTFGARVTAHFRLDGAPAVVLDRTAFYATGGGQPHDVGVLRLPHPRKDTMSVLDVFVREEDQAIVHVLADVGAARQLSEGDLVQGEIDWNRRFDVMQQHTGQHILSQTFVRVAGADTVGFHLSDEYSTVDLSHDSLGDDHIARAESLANQVVFENRPVLTQFVPADDVAKLPLRKPPAVKDAIRVVQVEGFDWSACGGTHVARTGEVGLIKVVRSERRGSETRITFLCGRRALSHYSMVNSLTRDLAMNLSVGVEELSQTIERLQSEVQSVRKERNRLHELLLDHEALALIAKSRTVGTVLVVCQMFESREMEEVRRLATRIATQPGHVALLGVKGEKGQLVFARATDLSCDMRPLLHEACRIIGGSGGGGRELAQGGGPHADRVAEALQHAMNLLRRQIEQSNDCR